MMERFSVEKTTTLKFSLVEDESLSKSETKKNILKIGKKLFLIKKNINFKK